MGLNRIFFYPLWSEVYKGVEVYWREHRLWIGWTTRKYKRLGW